MEEIKKKIFEFINEVKHNPGTMFGFLYPYILLIIVIIGLYYVANEGNVALNKQPAFVPDSVVVADLPVVAARTVPPVDIFKLKEPSAELIAEGKQLYTTNCASCHNETGAGGGPASVGLNPAPRNFTNSEGWKNGKTLSAIYTTLEEGIEGSAMISYNFLTPQERIELAHYIRQEFVPNPPADTDEDLSALNSIYNLSSGMKVPAQIPVAAAMEIISSENSQKEIRLETALRTINNNKNNYSVVLFEFIVEDERLALSSLINSNDWKNNQNTFFNFIVINSNYNGFNSEILNLSDSDRNLLFNYLNQLL
ncbi:MAG TPA: cytochrome c [Ignavibacteriaceae bacterium]